MKKFLYTLLFTLCTVIGAQAASFRMSMEGKAIVWGLIEATGGTEVEYSQGGTNWKAHIFTDVGTNTLTITVGGSAQYLVIAGAGGGGGGWIGGNWTGGGAGGAGGYRCSVAGELSGSNSSPESAVILIDGVYSIIVGAGGSGGAQTDDGTNGVDSVIKNPSLADVVRAIGGGGGAGAEWFTRRDGNSGGSGGGGAGKQSSSIGGRGIVAQGFDGGTPNQNRGSGAGGGAAGVGLNGGGAGTDVYGKTYTKTHGGSGGPGISSSITGSSVQRVGGGGGGCDETNNYEPGFGGDGGGGDGGTPTFTAGQAGTVNTGSGGGGGTQAAGGNGGSES